MSSMEPTRPVRFPEIAEPRKWDRLEHLEERFRQREPSVLAFLPEEGRFERLREELRALEDHFPQPAERPPLFGLPAGVKDIFHAEGFPTRAGSRLPEGELRGPQAESVTRLIMAGAVLLGKTVTTEFAYFTPGPTRNPHHPGHTPGGSSSGSAAAVGAGMCPLALGTQTIGSLIRPAAYCGVVALKPTYDRIPRDGVIPLSPSLDHVGFFCPDTATARLAAPCLYTQWEEAGSTDRKPTLGIPEGSYLDCASEVAQACFEANCQALSEAGYELRRLRVMDDFEEIRARHDRILSTEAARVHADWYGRYADRYSPRFHELIQRGRSTPESHYRNALESRDAFRAQMEWTMEAEGIDLWICPSTVGPAPPGLYGTGDPVMNLPWTQAGLPAINLPSGSDPSGLPLGLQVIGRWNSDESLLAWSQGMERVLNRR